MAYRAPDGRLWSDVAAENGISPGGFSSRIVRGMTPEQAATKPHYFRPLNERNLAKCDEAAAILMAVAHDLRMTDPKSEKTLRKLIANFQGWTAARAAAS